MALTATEQKLLDFAKGTLPTWFTSSERELEFLAAAAKIMGQSHTQIGDWFGNTLIGDAVGPVSFDPDWLNQHAVDRGTARQDAETDVALRQRLRSIEDALTLPTLLAAAQAIVDAEAIVGTVAMLELNQQAAYASYLDSDFANDGGEFFAPGGTLAEYEPTTKPLAPQLLIGATLVIFSSPSAANDGAFTVTGLNGNRIQYTNASVVAEAAPGGTWVHVKHNKAAPNEQVDLFQSNFVGRGYRTQTVYPTLGDHPAVRLHSVH